MSNVIEKLKAVASFCDESGRTDLGQIALAATSLISQPKPIPSEVKDRILIELLYERGIGIASLDEMKARTRAVARGELKLPADEPKLWFGSIEAMVEALRKCYFGSPSEDF